MQCISVYKDSIPQTRKSILYTIQYWACYDGCSTLKNAWVQGYDIKQVRNQDFGNGASQVHIYRHSETESCDWNKSFVPKVQEPLQTF